MNQVLHDPHRPSPVHGPIFPYPESEASPDPPVSGWVYLGIALLMVVAFSAVVLWQRLGQTLVGIEVELVGGQRVETLQWGSAAPETIHPKADHEFLLVKMALHNKDASYRNIHLDQFVLEGDGFDLGPLDYWPLRTTGDLPATVQVMSVTLNRQLHPDETFVAELLFEAPENVPGKSVRFRAAGHGTSTPIVADVISVERVAALQPVNDSEDHFVRQVAGDGRELLRLWLRLDNTASTGRQLTLDDFHLTGDGFSERPMEIGPVDPQALDAELLQVSDRVFETSLDGGEGEVVQLFFDVPEEAAGRVLELARMSDRDSLGDLVYSLFGAEKVKRVEVGRQLAPPGP